MKTITCCPHCKERPQAERYVNECDYKASFFVECPMCGMRGPYMETYKGAVDAWNAFADVIEGVEL